MCLPIKKGEIKIDIKKKEKTLEKGQVITVYKDRYIVEHENIKTSMQVSGRFNYNHFLKSEYPQVGDYVNFHKEDQDLGIIESVLERKSILSRLDVGLVGERQILAVNIDVVFICMSLNQDFNIKKLRNFLSVASGDNYEVIILLTKRDLVDNLDQYLIQINEVTEHKTVSISAFYEEDIAQMSSLTKDKTSVFIGSSGVGKSTIINGLIGKDYLETKSIRVSDAQGMHTTVNRELIKLDNGGKVIDTPGLRIISSYFVDESSFEDILSISEGCMFNDCTHTVEPGCMIKKSIHDGILDAGRFNQYNKAMKLNAYNLAREKQRQKIIDKKNKRR